jgi:hypothetical protein
MHKKQQNIFYSIPRQRLGKDVSAATNTHVRIGEPLELAVRSYV